MLGVSDSSLQEALQQVPNSPEGSRNPSYHTNDTINVMVRSFVKYIPTWHGGGHSWAHLPAFTNKMRSIWID